MSTTKVLLTARARVRAEITAEIKRCARDHLREVGAATLSLRAVARDLGIASSAVYRYYPNRNELLTDLMQDAFEHFAEAVEAAAEDAPGARERWISCCHAARNWARANPHEYALIYGAPTPGFEPSDVTAAAAARSARVFATIAAAGTVEVESERLPDIGRQLQEVVADLAPDADPATLARGLVAWTQLLGMISFELFGQLNCELPPTDEFFGYAVEHTADFMGLSD